MEDRVYISTENGYGLSYSVDQIPLTSLKTKGVKGMNIENGDGISDFLISQKQDSQCILINDEGSMKRLRFSDIAELKRPAKGVRLAKFVKSHPVKVEKMIEVQDLHQKFTFCHEDVFEFEAREITLMTTSATYSAPFGKVDHMEWNEPLPFIHEGSWKEKETYEQVSLFEEDHE